MVGASMEAPYTIASVPQPLDSAHGQIQASPVYSLRESRKRKRHEVAVGIDGEGVNIYNIQSQNLVTSYALPPQSYLSCPPCSIYRRSTADSGACRTTFLVVRDGPHDLKRRLISFTETVSSKNNKTSEFAAPAKRECRISGGGVVGIDAASCTSDERLSIIVHYQDGRIDIAKDDLSKTHQLDAANASGNYEVEHTELTDLDTVRRGILKSREDVVARLDQNSAPVRSDTLLCRLVRTDKERRLELFSLRDTLNSPVQSTQAALQHLVSVHLPFEGKRGRTPARYELHPASGMLYQLLGDRLNIFDLSGTVPKLITKLGSKSTPIKSFARVSNSSVLAFSTDVATLYETTYGSVQGSVSLSNSTSATAQSRKRKRDDNAEAATTFNAIASFTDLGVIAGLSGHEVVAIQLDDALRASEKKGSRGTLLSHVFNKGNINDSRHSQRAQKNEKKWDEWTAHVDNLIIHNDIDGLEELVANDPLLGKQRQIKKSHDDPTNGLQNGDAMAYGDLWPLPETFDPSGIDRRKALYILSQMFEYSSEEQERLVVKVVSLKLLEWLALAGFLSVSSLRTAFQATSRHEESSDARLISGAIMAAVRHIDDDYQLMRDLLCLPVHWEAAEVVQALRLVVQSFSSPLAAREPLLALPAPPLPNGHAEMTNGDIESDINAEERAAENDLDLAANALDTGLEVRSELLHVIITRLHAFPQTIISEHMRAMMSNAEIIFFIHILRIELGEGGWTSQYVDVGDEEGQAGFVNSRSGEDQSGPSDQAIQAIGDLLNCAVNAIGTSGWLIGQSSAATGTDELIDTLRAEVGAGLESCYEANTLSTLLTELERCAATQKSVLSKGYGDDDEDTLLPLGSRHGAPAVPGRDGNTRKKTKMEIGREKSRNVGKYSFERIRI